MSESTAPGDTLPEGPDPAVRRKVIRGAVIAVALMVVSYFVLDFIETVDWGAVVDALGRVTAPQLAALFALLLVRASLNASPLSVFLGNLSIFRATLSDVSATLVSTFAPPPADSVLRVKIFASWGIPPARGLAAATMNVLVFYVNRLLVPIVGAVILMSIGDGSFTYWLIGLACLAGALVLLVMGRAALESEAAARRTGERAGELVQRVRRSVDPAAIGERVLDFRNHVVDRYLHTLRRSLPALFVMTVVDACMVLVALRFTGTSASLVPALLVIGAFLVFYPMTIFPFGGLGVLDTVLLGIFVASAGEAYEADILAGLAVYRVVSIGGPMLLGAMGLLVTRRLPKA